MSRYIDADAWWKAVQKHYTDADCANDDRYELGINVGITKSRNVMMNAPSIEIVRCQDCKHWVYNFNGCSRNPCTEPWYATDFCNYGEREGE